MENINGQPIQEVQPQQPQPQNPNNYDYKKPTNGFAIAGFVLSFFFQVLGIIFSAIGLSKSKDLENSGKKLSIAGIAISSVIIIVGIIMGIVYAPRPPM